VSGGARPGTGGARLGAVITRARAGVRRPAAVALALGTSLLMVTGCGLQVKEPDLFLLTRTGQGTKLTLLVNDSGTISCNGAPAKPITGTMLIAARDLSDDLGKDATAKLTLASGPGTVFSYRIRLQQGTISFGDHDTEHHQELARAELFAASGAQQVCGLSG